MNIIGRILNNSINATFQGNAMLYSEKHEVNGEVRQESRAEDGGMDG